MHDLIPNVVPETAAGRIESVRSKAIMTARSFRAGFDPAFSAQHLEVPTDGRLWELQDRPQLVDAQLIPLEGEQKPAPRRVGEGCHLAKKGRGGQRLNPFIRIKGYNRPPIKSSTLLAPPWRPIFPE